MKKIAILLSIALLLIGLTSCKKDETKIETNSGASTIGQSTGNVNSNIVENNGTQIEVDNKVKEEPVQTVKEINVEENIKFDSMNNDMSINLSSDNGMTSYTFKVIEKDLKKFYMTAGLDQACYLDLLKSEIRKNLSGKELSISEFDGKTGVGKIKIKEGLGISLIEKLQTSGFLENETNTNDIEPMIMLFCGKKPE